MIPRIGLRAILCVAATLALWSAGVGTADAQQTGTVQGVVVDATTQRPLTGAQVTIQGTQIGTLTNQQGRFQLINVPAGTHTLRVELVGYGASTRQITVVAGQPTTINITLEQTAIALQELVVTGVSGGAMERAKVPFTVTRIEADQMPVQAVNPLSQLQGRVPGANIAATSGRPGRAPEVILRGPTSINAQGRGQEPLYIVDGIVLGASIADINPADIESVEVVKGAAASTLYGSRAAGGVIAITTRRGATGMDGVRFTARSELGFNDIERDFGIARNHPFLLDESGTRFCVQDDQAGARLNTCTRTINYLEEQTRINDHPGVFALPTVSFPVDPGAVTPGPFLRRTFVAGQWPGTTFNAVDQLVDPKPLTLNDFSMAGRIGQTNFFSSVGHARQAGAIQGREGYERVHGRINVGHRFADHLSIDVNSFISRSTDDGADQDEGGTGFFRLTRAPAIVDITRRDDLGRLFIRTNLGSAGTQNENPLYSFENTGRQDMRWRFLGGTTLRYTPLPWLEGDATFNVDRLNYNYLQFNNRGFRTTNPNPTTNQGIVFNGTINNTSLNTSAGVLFRPNVGDWIAPRFTLRWLYEEQDSDMREVQGQFLRVAGVRAAQNATQQQIIRSSATDTRQMSFAAGSFLDVLGRYTFDFALRHDGNSRFGEEQRWQTYGRASAAWLVAQEPWFQTDAVNTLTFRTSYGTAGNAPNFAAQYETYTIGAGGVLTAATLGNPQLRPEVMREIEAGIEVGLFNRFGLTVTYANSLTTDQILPVPVSVATGFPNQWQNAGDLRNRTWEAALDVPVIQNGRFNWTSRINYTSTSTTIETLNTQPFFIGTNLQATDAIIRIAEGLPFGTLWGRQFITSCNQLPGNFAQQCGGAGTGAAFQPNQHGYIVWVGQGNDPGMGITHNLWNAVAPLDQTPWGRDPQGRSTNNQTYWGTPILLRDSIGAPQLGSLGTTLPNFRVGMSHTVGWRGLSVYGLFEGVFGRHVWNQGRHWSYLDFLSEDVDMGGRSVQDALPIAYFWRAGQGIGGSSGYGGLYDILGPNSHFVEDASFIKLRELSAAYNVGAVRGVGNWTVSVVGRNLKTWTDYTGFDPEVGAGAGTGQARQPSTAAGGFFVQGDAGSSIINGVDAFTFPQLRTLSFVLSTTF
jgi:TonB-linked SusC/RagA family outer membrane protein